MVSPLSFAPKCGYAHGCDTRSSGLQRRRPDLDSAGDNQTTLRVRDELSLSSSHLTIGDDGSYEQTGLKLSSRSVVRVGEEVQISARSDSRLRFRYNFESADGTKISVRAKVNLQYSYRSDGTVDTESLKLNVKFGVSVVQQSVAEGVNPLLDGAGLPDEAKNAIAAATQLFQHVTDGLTSAFLDADPSDGDGLITSLVDAFNEFAGTLQNVVLSPQSALPQEDNSAGESSAPADVALPEPVLTVDDSPQGETPGNPVQSPVVVETELPSGTEQPSDSSAGENVADGEPAEATEVVESGGTTDSEANELLGPEAGSAVTNPEDARDIVKQALLVVRARVVTSLQSLTRVLDNGNGSTSFLASRLDLRTSARLSAYYAESAGSGTKGQPAANLDLQA